MKLSNDMQDEMNKLRQMTEQDIDYSDISETDESWFASATLALGLASVGQKSKISMMLDHDVLDYFKASGKGYQTRINAVLKGYVWSKRHLTPSPSP